jgi:hydrogenase expression/formation protein HypC
MCLAVPGRILSIAARPPETLLSTAALPAEPGSQDDLWWMAEVDFGGVRQLVSLACLPEARVGDRVLVHVGLALSIVDDSEP